MKPSFSIPVMSLALLILTACSSSKAVYQLNPITQPPSFPAMKSTEELQSLYPAEDGVYLSYRNILEHVVVQNIIFGSEVTIKRLRLIERTYVVFNPDDTELSSFTFREGDHKLMSANLKITHPDGTVDKVVFNQLKKEKDVNGDQVYKYAYPNVKRGSIIQEYFSYEMDQSTVGLFRDMIETEFVFSSTLPILDYSFNYTCPVWWKVQFKSINIPDSVIILRTDDKKKQKDYSIHLSNLPSWVEEPFSPIRREVVPSFKVRVTESGFLGANLNFLPPKDWASVSDFYQTYAVNENFLFNLSVKDKVKKMVGQETEPSAKAKAILTEIRNTITLESGKGFKDFSDVLSSKKGNALNITGLSQALLREAGIRSDFIMMYNRANGPYDDSFTNLTEFEIPALRVFLDADTVYSVPYVKRFPYLFLPDYLRGQPALIVRDKDAKKAKKGTAVSKKPAEEPAPQNLVIRVPDQEDIQNEIRQSSRLTLREEGTIDVSESFRLTGGAAVELREELEKLKPEEIENKLIEHFLIKSDNLSGIKTTIRNLNEADSALTIGFAFAAANLTTITPEEVLAQIGVLIGPVSLKKYSLENERRALPIHVINPFQYRRDVTISSPTGWLIQKPVEPAAITTGFGVLQMNSVVDGNTMNIQYDLKINAIKKPASQYPDLKALLSPDDRFSPGTLVYTIGK